MRELVGGKVDDTVDAVKETVDAKFNRLFVDNMLRMPFSLTAAQWSAMVVVTVHLLIFFDFTTRAWYADVFAGYEIALGEMEYELASWYTLVPMRGGGPCAFGRCCATASRRSRCR